MVFENTDFDCAKRKTGQGSVFAKSDKSPFFYLAEKWSKCLFMAF
jgi:hypothetical protein